MGDFEKKIRGMVSLQTFMKRKVGWATISKEQPSTRGKPALLARCRERCAWHVESHGGSQTALDPSSKRAFASDSTCKVT